MSNPVGPPSAGTDQEHAQAPDDMPKLVNTSETVGTPSVDPNAGQEQPEPPAETGDPETSEPTVSTSSGGIPVPDVPPTVVTSGPVVPVTLADVPPTTVLDS